MPPQSHASEDLLDLKSGSTCSTTDINLAAFLASRGFDPVKVEPPPVDSIPKFAVFVFERTENLSDTIVEWTANSPLSADLRSFLEKRREFLHWARSVARGGAR